MFVYSSFVVNGLEALEVLQVKFAERRMEALGVLY